MNCLHGIHDSIELSKKMKQNIVHRTTVESVRCLCPNPVHRKIFDSKYIMNIPKAGQKQVMTDYCQYTLSLVSTCVKVLDTRRKILRRLLLTQVEIVCAVF